VIVVRLLAVVVTIRIGTSTAYALLKGAGQHQFAAASSVAIAVANLVLSIILVRPFGLVGIALGTLTPVAIACIFILIPKACRRAQLPLTTMIHRAIWPALWPAVPAALAVLAMRAAVSTGLVAVLAGSAAGGLVYAVTFLAFAVDESERQRYLRLATAIFRRPDLAAAASP
jgi:O-antigen/teichoic acid export membrane protein